MSDSGFSNVPTGPRPSDGRGRGNASSELKGRLIGVPNELREIKAAVRIRGEIARAEPRFVEIRTERGASIEVRLPPDTPPPRQGEPVEITIRPAAQEGSPPQRVEIRALPPPPATGEAQTPPARDLSTPVEVYVAPPREPLAVPERFAQPPNLPPPPVPGLPPPGAVVRLQPVPAQALPPLPQNTGPAIETTAAQIVQTTSLSASITAANATSDLINALLSSPALNTPLANTPVLSTPTLGTPVVNTPILNTPAFVQLTAPQQLQTQSTPPSALQVALQAPPALTPQLTQAQANTLAEPILITAQVTDIPALPIAGRRQPVNALITNVQLPSPLLATAQQSPSQTMDAPQAAPLFAPSNSLFDPASLFAITQTHHAGQQTAQVVQVLRDNVPVVQVPSAPLSPSGIAQPPAFESFFILNAGGDIAPPPGALIAFAPLTPASAGEAQATLQSPLPNAPQLTSTQALPPLPLPSLFAVPDIWPLMEELQQSLARTAPQIAQATMAMTPSPANPAQFGAAALFFLAAVRGGDLSQWLGTKAHDILQRSAEGRSLLGRLGQEGGLISRLEPAAADWRTTMLPLFWEGETHKAVLHYKHEERDNTDDPDQKGRKQTRFIFDISLSRLGPVQLDGLFRPGRLDLILRTQEPLSQAMMATMKRGYAGALVDTEITGELSFQNTPEQWVTVQVKDHPGGELSA